MRIIYFGSYWTGYGGTEFDVRTMLTHLARRGYKCIHIGYSGAADRGGAHRTFEQEGVEVVYFEGVSPNISARLSDSRAAALKALKDTISSNDILITIFLPELEAWRIAREAGAKVIQKYAIVEDGYDPKEWKDLVDLHVFNSDFCCRWWMDRGLEGFNMVIHPEIDIERSSSEYMIEDGCIGLVHPSRHKGLEIVEGLARAFRDEKFLSVGGWSVKESKEGPGGALIEYTGHIEDISEFYKRLKVLLVPTQDEHTETFGRIVLEGMCHGIPVIASDKDGLPEAADGAAVLVKDYDRLHDWVSALRDMLEEGNLKRYHERSLLRADRYNLRLLITRWEIAFNVLGGSRIEVVGCDGSKK